MELKCAKTTGLLIDLFFSVYKRLGYGFTESLYSNAMVVAGRRLGLKIEQETMIRILFEGVDIGVYKPDLIVNNAVIVELKACNMLIPEHEAQLLTYLKATSFEVGFLFNFGPKAQYKRMIYDNQRKETGFICLRQQSSPNSTSP
jgi:GxxExxY protein